MTSGSERGFEHIEVVKVQHSGDAEKKKKKKKTKSGLTLVSTMNHKNNLLAFRESEEERELRIRKLFNFFDAANTGYLDKVKFETGLCALGKTAADCNKYAAELLKACDMNSDGLVDYQDFQAYMDDKEIELYTTFQAINVKRDGFISLQELRQALVMAGIEINDKELGLFIEVVDKDNNGTITFEKWRDFLLFYPHEATIENIYQYLDRACITDMGEQASIPEDISQDGNAFKFFLVGGITGATSRTATAPLDRIKVALQIQTESALIVPAIKNIWKEGGIMGFFRGNGLNVLKVAPESAIRFYTYEILKNCFISDNGEDEGDIGTAERLIAGGMAGAVAQTAIYPLDFVKTRLQTYVCNVGIFPKVETLVKSIWIHEGPQAFYRGLIPSLLGVIPYAGIDFAAYELLKDMSKTHALQEDPGALVQLCCGTISGALGASCVYPLQVIRTRMQAQYSGSSTAYKGMRDVIRRTLRCEGYRGFYGGFFPNLLKVVPSASITYLVYESMKKGLDL